MKKVLRTVVLAGVMSMVLGMTAYAGEWKQDDAGKWYQNDDGSYYSSGWNWIDGKCYYFGPEGYCLVNTQTPDGSAVNEDGAWVVDGVVQTQETAAETLQLDGLTVTVPAGFKKEVGADGTTIFSDDGKAVAFYVDSEAMEEAAGNEELLEFYSGTILDEAMNMAIGAPDSTEVKAFPTGEWRCYNYADGTSLGMQGAVVRVYVRISGVRIQMVIFGGTLSNVSTDDIMKDYIR